jgi:hypothetical protein
MSSNEVLKTAGALLALALLALGVAATSSASATVLCKTATSPCTSGPYGVGTLVELDLKSETKSVLHTPAGNIECSEAVLEAEITKAGGEATNVSGANFFAPTFKGCNATVTALKAGTFTIEAPSGGNGTLKLEGLETTTEFKGLHCIYSGSTSLPITGGEMASAGGAATLSHTGGKGGAFCGTTAEWTVEYTVTAPAPLFVEEKAAPSVALCKTATSPCSGAGSTYGKGTVVEASLKSGTNFSLQTGFGEVKCLESTIKGEVTNAGGSGTPVSIAVTSFNLGNCNCGVTVLQKGSFSIEEAAAGNGNLVSSNFETTAECLAFHCVFKTSSTPIGTWKGGETATVAMEGKMPRTGGRSESSCGSEGTLAAEYKVTSPAPMYVEEKAAPSPVLCNTATNPCSSSYGKGTVIEANVNSGVNSILHTANGNVECSEGTLDAEVTSSEGISGVITVFNFKECNGVVVVNSAGIFSGGGNGTLNLRQFETTTEFKGFHCIYTGPASFFLAGGAMAATGGTATLNRMSGRSGTFCGSTASWTVTYTVTKPEPLYMEET